MFKRFLLAFFGIMMTFQVSGTHLLGGEIWWRCLTTGPNAGKYHFYLRLYRDCGGASIPTGPQTISGGPLGSISVSTLTDVNDPYYVVGGYPRDASPVCAGTGISCATATTNGTGAIEEGVWRTNQPVTLSGVPPSSGWVFSWSSCCRPTTANVSGQPSYFLRAIMYPYNDGTGNRNANPCFDSSPRFLEIPKVVTCTGYQFDYNNFAFDEELDSLYFDWDDPLTTGLGSVVPWQAGYSTTSPLPGIQNFAQDAGQVTINTTQTGQFATCMRVDAFRYGQRVASIFRDIPIVLISCPGSTNNPPTLDLINDPAPAPQLTPVVQGSDTIYWDVTVNAGEFVSFSMQSQDLDFLPGFQQQTIKFIGVGGNLGDPLNSTTNCLFQPPCATVTPTAPQSGFNSTLTNNVEFDWQTTCDHLSYQATAGGSRKNQYLFYFKMEDNACPAPSFKLVTVRITVISPPPVPPSMDAACIAANPDGTVSFTYTEPAAADTAQNFDGYAIYRGGNGSPFVAYDTLWGYASTSYTDQNPLPGANYYYVTSLGGCDQESLPSDTLSVINMTLTPFPATNSYVANLNWNKPRYGVSASNFDTIYEVWQRPLSGTWAMIGSTRDTFYSDTVNFCGADLEYQIRIGGACESFSDSGYFSDQNNNDALQIGYATVQGGQAALVWPASSSGDVVEYVILEQQPGVGWVNVDQVPVGTPTPYVIPTSVANTKPETYKVVSLDSCGNQSSDLLVRAHTTMYLEGDLNPCDGEMFLRWNNYKGWLGGVEEYAIMADIVPQTGPAQNGVLIGTNLGDDTTYMHTNLQPGAQYCYYIQAIDTAGNTTTLSSRYCINSSIVIQSKIEYLARTTVKVDGSIEVWAFIDGQADVLEHQVQRAEDTLGPWITVGVVPQPTVAPYQVRFTDFSAEPSSAKYFYRIRSVGACGGADTISNYGTNIFLEVSAQENLSNRLTWNAYRDYNKGVDHYNVYRKADDAQQWTLVANNVTEPVYVDNIRSMRQGQGQFCYRVAAVERPNEWSFVDEAGGRFTSFSNEACTEHEVRGFFPTAFRPGSASPANQVWKPQLAFENEADYHMMIQNRWGQKVFESNNTDEGWDGTYQGQEAQEGTYQYIVRYRSIDGQLKEQRGTFVLIR